MVDELCPVRAPTPDEWFIRSGPSGGAGGGRTARDARPSAPPSDGVERSGSGATLVGESPDRRRLLRGLLGLAHRNVTREATSLGALPTDDPLELLVVDVAGADARWSELLRRTLADSPERPSLVLLPADDAQLRATAARAGARAVLSYPFSTRDFADAIRQATRALPAPARPAPPE